MGKRYVIVACAAGINTSTFGADAIREELNRRKIKGVEVKHIDFRDIQRFLPETIVVVAMAKFYGTLDVPQVKGLPFLIGSPEEQRAALDQVMAYVEAELKE